MKNVIVSRIVIRGMLPLTLYLFFYIIIFTRKGLVDVDRTWLPLDDLNSFIWLFIAVLSGALPVLSSLVVGRKIIAAGFPGAEKSIIRTTLLATLAGIVWMWIIYLVNYRYGDDIFVADHILPCWLNLIHPVIITIILLFQSRSVAINMTRILLNQDDSSLRHSYAVARNSPVNKDKNNNLYRFIENLGVFLLVMAPQSLIFLLFISDTRFSLFCTRTTPGTVYCNEQSVFFAAYSCFIILYFCIMSQLSVISIMSGEMIRPNKDTGHCGRRAIAGGIIQAGSIIVLIPMIRTAFDIIF